MLLLTVKTLVPSMRDPLEHNMFTVIPFFSCNWNVAFEDLRKKWKTGVDFINCFETLSQNFTPQKNFSKVGRKEQIVWHRAPTKFIKLAPVSETVPCFYYLKIYFTLNKNVH